MTLLRAVWGRRLDWHLPWRSPERKPTARELMGMERNEFREFIATTGLAARISEALRKHEHDAA